MEIKAKTGSNECDITVRDRLLMAAAQIFNSNGYSATTVREIVAAAGVTKPVLYYYFHNKEGIYIAIMERAQEELNRLFVTLRESQGSAREKIYRVLDELFKCMQQHREIVRLIHAGYYGPPNSAPPFNFDAFDHTFHDTLRALAEEGVRMGEFRTADPQDLALAIGGIFAICHDIELIHPEMAVGPNGLRRILDLILNGIAVDGVSGKEDQR